jgi:hypothetical protein
VNIRIGMIQSAKELELELDDDASATVADDVTKAIADEKAMLWLTDRKGRQVGVATAKVAWIELGAEGEGRRVGFSAV